MKRKRTVTDFLLNLMVLPLIVSVASCDIKDSNADRGDSFAAVYDHPDMNLSFFPVDMVQTSDDGFLVLSVYTDTTLSTFPLIRVMKTDGAGILIREIKVESSWCSAVPALMKRGNFWQFVCMDAVNQNVKLMQVDEDLSGVSEIAELAGKYPLYLFTDSHNDFVVLTFNRIARTSVLTKYSAEGQQLWQNSFNINEDYKNQVETHLKKGGKQFPFFIEESGEAGDAHYMVNCFNNYTMTLLFIGSSTGDRTGQLNTYQDDAAVSAMVSLDSNFFAISRYYMGDNYIFPLVTLDMNITQGANNFEDMHLPELTSNASMRSMDMTLHEREVVVFASQTRANNLVLYFFDRSDGTLLTTRYLSSTNPVNIAGMLSTRDGGLALLAQHYAAGRFPRIAIYKLSPEEISFDE